MPLKMKIHVKVIPNSKTEKIEKMETADNWFIVRVKEPAEKGKANKALVKLLKKYFKKQVRIVSGFTSRRKIVEIERF